MEILIRADASVKIGTGHVMRCLALASELRFRGAKISFICREETGNLIDLIRESNYKVFPLPDDLELKDDIRLMQAVIENSERSVNWLIVDHYLIDYSWELHLKDFVDKVMVIDDFVDRRHECDLLLNQSCVQNGNHYEGFVPEMCIKLMGPKYALLRPQFNKARGESRERDGKIERILVFIGGVDLTNETSKVLKAIQTINCSIIADVVVGATNPHREEIEALASNMHNVTCHYDVENMASLMMVADLSIGASGTTTWERCCLGLPSIVIAIAENQLEIAKHLGGLGVVCNLGWHRNVNDIDLRNAINHLIDNPGEAKELSLRSKKLVDGKGVERVSNELCRLN